MITTLAPELLQVRPWADPVLDRHGHDPRDSYCEQYRELYAKRTPVPKHGSNVDAVGGQLPHC